MKTFVQRWLGQSWKTTLVSYILAVLLAVQPLLEETTNLNNRYEFARYLLRLLFAAGVAFLGKYAADSSQVKNLRKYVEGTIEQERSINDS
ncbi:MAG TPA: hypothetical protein VMR70_21355 [Flavisolibacter sp.]|nr:hypothetical protein [Flavisolibacter sp.]